MAWEPAIRLGGRPASHSVSKQLADSSQTPNGEHPLRRRFEMTSTDLRNIRVIALADLAARGDLVELLLSLNVQVHLVQKLADLPRVARADGVQDIVFLPGEYTDGEAWSLNGVLNQYKRPPVFFVYAQEVDFARWSGVLDAGGTDIIALPVSIDKLRAALEQAVDRRP